MSNVAAGVDPADLLRGSARNVTRILNQMPDTSPLSTQTPLISSPSKPLKTSIRSITPSMISPSESDETFETLIKRYNDFKFNELSFIKQIIYQHNIVASTNFHYRSEYACTLEDTERICEIFKKDHVLSSLKPRVVTYMMQEADFKALTERTRMYYHAESKIYIKGLLITSMPFHTLLWACDSESYRPYHMIKLSIVFEE